MQNVWVNAVEVCLPPIFTDIFFSVCWIYALVSGCVLCLSAFYLALEALSALK